MGENSMDRLSVADGICARAGGEHSGSDIFSVLLGNAANNSVTTQPKNTKHKPLTHSFDAEYSNSITSEISNSFALIFRAISFLCFCGITTPKAINPVPKMENSAAKLSANFRSFSANVMEFSRLKCTCASIPTNIKNPANKMSIALFDMLSANNLNRGPLINKIK